MDKEAMQYIKKKLVEYEKESNRKSLTYKYPILREPVQKFRQSKKYVKNFARGKLAKEFYDKKFSFSITRHQSVLMRKLGDTDIRLQKDKVRNLRIATKKLNNLVIQPGEYFSFWQLIGKPSYERGFVDGMLLCEGKIIEGLGGGLCQMSNLLYWMFLHSPLTITERHHHGLDVFPDSGRVLPFGTGATILYNYQDLQVKNEIDEPVQIKVSVTKKYLKGQLRSQSLEKQKYHVHQKNHLFVRSKGRFYRFNEIWRDTLIKGKIVKSKKLYFNFFPVLYEVYEEYLERLEYKVLDV